MKTFIDKAITLDRGFGRQVALLIKHWTTKSPEGHQMSLFKLEETA
jgi:hypothetical protein